MKGKTNIYSIELNTSTFAHYMWSDYKKIWEEHKKKKEQNPN
jgi:hypothetical protein